MSPVTVYRGSSLALELDLLASEPLVDGIHSFSGVPGYVTLANLDTGNRYDMAVADVLPDHEHFDGQIALDPMVDGTYQIQGWVIDAGGNCTVLGAAASPPEVDLVLDLEFSLVEGTGFVAQRVLMYLAMLTALSEREPMRVPVLTLLMSPSSVLKLPAQRLSIRL